MGFFEANTNLSQLFYLLGGHALADYVWQTERMVNLKHPRLKKNARGCVEEYGPWWWWMVAHGLIHGMLVGFILHWWVLGLLETMVHIGLDTAKCLKKITVNQDQAGHLLSKVVWAWLG